MLRCVPPALAVAIATAIGPGAALGQVRNFPANALRGELRVTQPPEALINGQRARLAPGARIRNEQNLVLVSGAIVERTLTVHYTLDPSGLVLDVWLLTPEERARQPWPTTPVEARDWRFDWAAQSWTRP